MHAGSLRCVPFQMAQTVALEPAHHRTNANMFIQFCREISGRFIPRYLRSYPKRIIFATQLLDLDLLLQIRIKHSMARRKERILAA
jgi:hypothetical protein